jgi:16S rRNA (guanine966-N2)-methyltransferase
VTAIRIEKSYYAAYEELMRVIAGTHRGRRLSGPQGTTLRPTSDKVREALFSILGSRIPGSRFLDLYAGTGAVGIEALSRGATVVTFVESDPKAVQVMRKNLTACRLLERANLRVGLTKVFFERPQWWNGPYDVVFADPPYAAKEAVELVLESWGIGLLTENAVMVIEQDIRAKLPTPTDRATLIRRYDYGDSALFLYGPATQDRSAS